MSALSQFTQSVNWSDLGDMILRVAAILICLIVHEVCHGLAAYCLGDPTAKMNHRLSLNPLRHLDIFGTLMMIVVGFGWAKPVPVDPRYFKKPKQGMAITALAGPGSNFVLAFLSAMAVNGFMGAISVRGETTALITAARFFYLLLLLNIGLGIFNLIPFPPLDGSKVLAMFLPDRAYVRWMQLERYGMFILMALLWLGIFDTFLFAARTVIVNGMLSSTVFIRYSVQHTLLMMR